MNIPLQRAVIIHGEGWSRGYIANIKNPIASIVVELVPHNFDAGMYLAVVRNEYTMTGEHEFSTWGTLWEISKIIGQHYQMDFIFTFETYEFV